MASYSRHSANYTRPAKTLPITLPAKVPTYVNPTSRVSISPPDYESSSSRHSGSSAGSYSVSSSRSERSSRHGSSTSGRSYRDDDKYDIGSRRSARGRVETDPMEMLTERFDGINDFSKLDRAMATQAQDSGHMNAAERELAELTAAAQRGLKTARVNFAKTVKDSDEIRQDLKYCRSKMDSINSKAERKHPQEFAQAKSKSRSRHAA